METDVAELRSGSTRFRITEDALVAGPQSIPLAEVTRVRIYLAQGRAFCLVSGSGGKPIAISTPPRASSVENDAYVSFIETLHDAVGSASPGAEFIAGHGAFFALLVVCIVGAVAIVITFVAALFSGANPWKAAPLLGTIVLPLLFVARSSSGRPRTYDPRDIPGRFMPPEESDA